MADLRPGDIDGEAILLERQALIRNPGLDPADPAWARALRASAERVARCREQELEVLAEGLRGPAPGPRDEIGRCIAAIQRALGLRASGHVDGDLFKALHDRSLKEEWDAA